MTSNTDARSLKLLPCPFCGGEPYQVQIGNEVTRDRGFDIGCRECRVKISDRVVHKPLEWLKPKNIENWNKRRSDARSPAPEPVADEMVENGCRGMYGPNWDGPAEKQPGELMKNVWRKYSRNCLTAALASPPQPAAPEGEIAELVQQLREKAKWREDIHGDLHNAAADMIEVLASLPKPEGMDKLHQMPPLTSEQRLSTADAILNEIVEGWNNLKRDEGAFPLGDRRTAYSEHRLWHSVQTAKAWLAAPQPLPAAPVASDEASKLTYNVGRWLSAALEDPEVCQEMKDDILAWMKAGEPNVQPVPDATERREQFARIIDPDAWQADFDGTPTERELFEKATRRDRKIAFAKADAILAAIGGNHG